MLLICDWPISKQPPLMPLNNTFTNGSGIDLKVQSELPARAPVSSKEAIPAA